MTDVKKWIVFAAAVLGSTHCQHLQHEQLPEFLEPVNNVTVTIGREATFTCVVDKLSDFKVAWIHIQRQMIISIHNKVITRIPRFAVSYDHQRTWRMTVRNVHSEDAGGYMCQVNSDPLLSQIGYLSVVVPPEISDNASSPSQVTVREGGKTTLICKAEGFPKPKVTWRREDGRPVVIGGDRRKVLPSFDGPELTISRVTRTDTGAFMCIATNGVPPTISKRTVLEVEFPPTVSVSQDTVGAPHGGTARFECQAEAWPRPIIYWVKGNDLNVLLTGKKHQTGTSESGYTSRISLGIQGISSRDYGGYRCIAKNALGEAEAAVKLHEIVIPTTEPPAPMQVTKEPRLFATKRFMNLHFMTINLDSELARFENLELTDTSYDVTTQKSTVSKLDAPRYTRDKSSGSGSLSSSAVSLVLASISAILLL